MFSCEFCEILKNTYFMGHIQATASGSVKKGCLAKILLEIWEIFLCENNLTIIPTNLIRMTLLSSFSPFVETKNKNQIFNEVGRF